MVLTPISWVFYLLVARKLYSKIFPGFPGIAYAGKRALNIAGITATVILAASVLLIRGPILSSRFLTGVFVGDRCILCGLSLFLLLLVIAISRYPIDIERNIAIHCMLFSAILFTSALLSVIGQFMHFKATDTINMVSAGVTAFLCFLWAVLLNPQGDRSTVRVRPRVDPAIETRLLTELNAINGLLLRAARR